MTIQQKNNEKKSYHHGDLRKSLIVTASEMVTELGIENLSLRKLAERIGVSRTAAYHHFADKNELLCAIAEQGFETWHKKSQQIFTSTQQPNHAQCREFIGEYLKFAIDNPMLYELMFGRVIWKENNSTETLKKIAYASFEHQVAFIKQWQALGIVAKEVNTLRLAQVFWATLHGMARLVTDGIYAQESQIEEMCDCALAMFTHST